MRASGGASVTAVFKLSVYEVAIASIEPAANFVLAGCVVRVAASIRAVRPRGHCWALFWREPKIALLELAKAHS